MKRLSLPVAAVLALGVVIYFGIHSRAAAASRLVAATEAAAVAVVDVVHPKPDAPAAELVLPGNTEAFTDTPIFARTSGYVTRWYVDIGARVTQGQLLAELETPELNQQLRQARVPVDSSLVALRLGIDDLGTRRVHGSHDRSVHVRDGPKEDPFVTA